MPLKLKLFAPRPGKTPNWTIRGSYMRAVAVDRSSRTPRRAAAQRELERIDADKKAARASKRKVGAKKR